MLYQNLYTRLLTLTLLTVMFTSPFLVPSAQAQETEADLMAMLEQRDKDIKQRLGGSGELPDAEKEELKAVVNDMIDFAAMGEAALGTHWDGLSEEQQTDFVQVFGDIVRHQSLSDVDIYRASVSYDAVDMDGNQAWVTTTTIYKEVPAKVEYDFLLKGGIWRARDIVLDDVSTVGGYSRSFQSVIRKRGFDALMNSLNKRLAKTRS